MAVRSGLPADRADDFVIALNEIAANAVRYGPPAARRAAGHRRPAGRGYVLDPTDVHSAFDQLLARGMDVIDDQMQALDRARRRVDHPDADGDGDGAG